MKFAAPIAVILALFVGAEAQVRGGDSRAIKRGLQYYGSDTSMSGMSESDGSESMMSEMSPTTPSMSEMSEMSPTTPSMMSEMSEMSPTTPSMSEMRRGLLEGRRNRELNW